MNRPLPNLRHLGLFLEVVRRGSVSAAARAAHLSQPAVTQAVAAVEAALGGKLLLRSVQGLQPTPAGLAVAARAERALLQLRELLTAMRGRGREARPEALRGITAAQLDALVRVTEHGSFAAAAARAGRSRAAMHRAVRQMEAAVGTALLEQSAGRQIPTRDGERLAQRARLAAAEIAQARDEVAQSMGRGGGATVIGAMPLARSILVPRAVLSFAAERPDHAVAILDGPYDTLLRALRYGTADLLIGALRDPAPAEDVVQEHLFDDPLSIIVRAGHPLTKEPAVRAVSLAKYAWIAPPPQSPLWRQFDSLYRSLDAANRAVPIECSSLVAARALLLGSDRLMLLSKHQVHHELKSGELAALPHPLGPVSRAIGLTLRRNWHPTEAQARLLDVLRTQARNTRGEQRLKREKNRLK
jgi:DNA-binding transcriptional LysR family regulator